MYIYSKFPVYTYTFRNELRALGARFHEDANCWIINGNDPVVKGQIEKLGLRVLTGIVNTAVEKLQKANADFGSKLFYGEDSNFTDKFGKARKHSFKGGDVKKVINKRGRRKKHGKGGSR